LEEGRGPLRLEVIVVDNGSTDGSAEMVREDFPQVKLIANEDNLGFPQAGNQGIKASHGPLILLLNSDTEMLPGTLPRLVEFMCAHPDAGLVGPAQRDPDGNPLVVAYDDPTLAREIGRNLLLLDVWRYRFGKRLLLSRYTAPSPVDWVMGAAMLVRREAIEAVGLLDEGVFMYGEEFDWCYRMRRAGWRVYYLPDVPIIHHHDVSGSRRFKARRYSLVTQSLYYFYAKHFGRTKLLALVVIHILGSLLRLGLLALPACLPHIGQAFRYEWLEHWHTLLVSLRYLGRMAFGGNPRAKGP
jgi:hypothetical protein